jgi:tRNA threonylcarbamoyladenosine modification (KEOPS) complex Cgi121 subunit
LETIEYKDYFISVGIFGLPSKNVLVGIEKLLNELSKDTAVVEVFRSDFIISLKQVYLAAMSAINAFNSKTNIARSLGIEILLRLSSETQIDQAIRKIGVNRDLNEVGVCIVARNMNELMKLSNKLLQEINGVELTEESLHSLDRVYKALEFYNVKQEEIESIQARDLYEAVLFLILERIATVDIER